MNAKVLVTVIAFVAMGLATAIAQITLEQLRTGSDEQLLREWTKVLASDEFGGRKPMTPYEDKTVEYLARQLEVMGLEPAFNGSWFQPFEMIAVTAKPVGGKLSVSGKKKSMLRYPDDLIIWTTRATKKIDLKKAEYVFCGFGINAPEFGWNDYEGIDVKGKIVVVMVNDPGFYDSQLFRGRNMTYYGRWLYKFEEAQRQGAAGCLVLHHTEAASYGWHVCVNGHLSDNLAIYDPDTRNAGELAVRGWLHEDGCRKLFLAAGMDMDKALADAKKPGFKSFPLNVRGDVKMNVTYDIQQTRNVGGILRGSSREGEAVVFCAHWDHWASGRPMSTVIRYTTVLPTMHPAWLELCSSPRSSRRCPRRVETCCSSSPRLRRADFSARLITAITLPCRWQRLWPALTLRASALRAHHDVVILGGGESDLDNYYVAAAAAQGRYIYFDDDNSDGWFYRSDHYNFVKKGVRAVVLENGLKPVDVSKPNKYPMPVWYHKPCDEYREDWDVSGTLSNVNLIFSVGLSLSNNL